MDVNMKIIDLTHTINEIMPVYPGTERPKLQEANTIERDGFKETLLTMFSHTGTHMDAPAHLFSGNKTLDVLPASAFAGSALVIDCRDIRAGEKVPFSYIEKHRKLADAADFLLFNFGWDKYWGADEYYGSYPCVDESIVNYVIESGKKGIGLDTISLDPITDDNLSLHKVLLSRNNAVIIENLTNLDKLGGELVSFFALPLKFENADGAPIRAVAELL